MEALIMHYLIKNAESITKMKDRHLFVCFSGKFAEECQTKEDLKRLIQEHQDRPPIGSISVEYEILVQYGNQSNYGALNLVQITAQAVGGGSADSVYQKFIDDSDAISGYFDKILHQPSQKELGVYWKYIVSLK